MYALEDSKKSLSYICFFDKAFIWTICKKSFRFGRLSLGYVVCFVSVHTISCCLESVSRFGHPLLMHVLYYFFFLPLFTTKSDTFFCCCIIKKVRGRRKLTFQTTAFR